MCLHETGTRSGTRRQIQDKSYFMALIRNKMSELYAEITKLQKENDRMQEEQRQAAVPHLGIWNYDSSLVIYD